MICVSLFFDPRPVTAMKASILFLSLSITMLAHAADGDPREQLPPHITRHTWFGERADWRQDGKRFVFLNRAYGDVYEY